MSRVAKNTLYNLVGQGLLLILSLVSVKYIYKRLGEEVLGVIYFVSTMYIILCSILTKGIYASTVREVSSYYEIDPEYIHDLIRTWSIFCWSVFLVFSIGVYFAAPLLVEKWINLSEMDHQTATTILQILGISSLLAIPSSFYSSLIRGIQRMEFTNIIDVSFEALKQLGIILILKYGGNVLHLVCWMAASTLLPILATSLILFNFFPTRSFVPAYSHKVFKRIKDFTSKMMAVTGLSMINWRIDRIAVSYFLPVSILGYYSIAYSLVTKAGIILNSVGTAVFPSFSALHSTGEEEQLLSQYKKVHELLCFIMVPIFAVFPYAVFPLFTYIFDAKVASSMFWPITLLSIGSYMNATLATLYHVSIATGKPEISIKQNIYMLFILPINIMLIYFIGILGAAATYITLNLFSYAYFAPRVCNECLNISVKDWYLQVFKLFGLAGLIYAAAWNVLEFYNGFSIPYLATAYIVATIIFLISAYSIMGNELRETIFLFFKDIIAKLRIGKKAEKIL